MPAAPAGRIYLGPCRAAAAAGLNPAGLKSDGFYLQTRGGDLFIIGRDGPEDPLQTTTLAGTLMGVYELLETQLGVRWLWPGELGTEVPRRTELTLPDLNLRYEPPLLQRQVRSGLNLRGDLSRGFTAEGASAYARAQTVFLRRHRMAQTVPLKYGHAYESWWEQHGQQHPEWFQLLANGKRGPASPRSRFSMCVSNPEFHEQVVQTWRELRQTRPGINLNGCENDIAGLCTCESCLAWDGPQPTDIHPRFGPRVVSDRYAQFWLTVQQMAAKEDPSAFVLGYAYVNYAPPPSEKIKLNENVWVGTVPDLFFPRSEEEQAWVKTQWEGWRRTGCRLFLRPNYTLDGYCMPQIYATQFADEFRFEAERGMIATDFDSLTGQWSTQGPNLYLLMRLHTRFERTADDLLAEYYAGFGPAGPKVREYFEQWERYSNDVVRKGKASGMGIYSTYASQAHLLFPEEALAASDKILAEAAALAREPAHTARVAWLRKGLEHAILASRTARLMAGGDDRYRPSAAR
ncbi:MAG: DUF4838 domain-containing protein, partial [Armatimonadetes bacterium]|nr:DUF4838 domain-containing protein [Armatimonadota bacterium]